MVSVFCSNTPESRKCILRGPDIKILQEGWGGGGGTLACSARKLHLWCQFFPSPPILKLLPPIYYLIENPVEHPGNKS